MAEVRTAYWSPRLESLAGSLNAVVDERLHIDLRGLHEASLGGDDMARKVEVSRLTHRGIELVAMAAREATFPTAGKLAAIFGHCLGDAFPHDSVVLLSDRVIRSGDLVMVGFTDIRIPACKVYLGTHKPLEPYRQFAGYQGEFVALWEADPEAVLIVPADEIAGLSAIAGIWDSLQGWREVSGYEFTPEQLKGLQGLAGRIQPVTICPEGEPAMGLAA